MTSHALTLNDILLEQLRVSSPEALLCIGALHTENIKAYCDTHNCHLEHHTTLSIENIKQQRYDLSIVQLSDSQATQLQAMQLIASIRNQLANQLLVITDKTKLLKTSDFYSLGFKKHATAPFDDKNVICYSYNIDRYNKKRSWNNAKNWANPENFGKYWW